MKNIVETIMMVTVASVFALGLIAAICVPIQLARSGDTIGSIATGAFSLFLFAILGVFAWAGYQEHKQLEAEVDHE